MFRPFFGWEFPYLSNHHHFSGDQPVGCDMIKKRRHVASSAQSALRCCFSWRKDRLTDARFRSWRPTIRGPANYWIRGFIPSFTHEKRGDLQGLLGVKITCSFCTAKIQGRMRLVNVNLNALSDMSSCTSSPKNGVFCFKKFFIIMIHNVSFTATKPTK